MAFDSEILQGSKRLDQAATGPPSIKVAPPYDDYEAVRKIQRGLHEVGYPMTISFKDGYDKPPDGKYGQETYDAVISFQRSTFPSDPKQWDGRMGPNTLRALDKAIMERKKITPPPTPGPCTPLDDSIPEGKPYTSISPDIMALLQRSYRERNAKNQNLDGGFGGDAHEACPQSKMTFKEVLDNLMKKSSFPVLTEIRNRAADAIPTLWSKIKWLNIFYDFGNSRGLWCCLYENQTMLLREQLRASSYFCADNAAGHSTHQADGGKPIPSQCYRELGRVGQAGLHVCVMVSAAKASEFGEWHNIHIDPHQIGGLKTKKCSCWYRETKHHFDDVGRYCVKWFLDKFGDKPAMKAACFVLGIDPHDTDHAYWVLMTACGDYDTFVDMGDNPQKYDVDWDVKVKAKLTLAALYKEAYMEYMVSQYEP